MEVCPDAAALHRDAIVVDGCSFFSTGWHPRLERAGVTALQMTVPWPDDDAGQALRRYAEYHHLVMSDARLALIETAADVHRCKREGRVGFVLGAQSAGMLGEDAGLLAAYHRVGVRVIQLGYNERNLLVDGCLEPSDAGLSQFGRRVVREMNRLGIAVDLSHVGERSSLEALEVSTKPCLFSHSNPRARAASPRNITDRQIAECALAGGVVGVSPWAPICWTGGAAPPALDDVVGHIEYVVERAGVDHVAVGTDSEATPGAYPAALHARLAQAAPGIYETFRAAFPDNPQTRGFETMEDLPRLTEALLRRGWAATDVRKVLGENLLRVYSAVWGG